jgi:hypothetical protein
MTTSLTTFASRQPATYIKGTVKPEGWSNSADMLAEANLAGWDVRLREIETDARTSQPAYEVIRTNPFDQGIDRLGISGARYVEFQNETVFAAFDHLNVEWEAAGQFHNGALVYGQAKTETPIVIDPKGANDIVQPFVVVSTGHGGKSALRIGRTALRLDCMNMFNMMMRGLTDTITIRHTKSGPDRIKEIVRAWKTNAAYYAAVEEEANLMYAQAATDAQFWGIVDQFQGERPELNTKGAQTKWDNSRELYAQAWNGETNAKAKGTAWGVFNALIERNQWGRTIQKTDNGLDNFAAAGMGFDLPTNRFRQNAYEASRALVAA